MTHKRLGDGFYEQRLVREQLAGLTGRASNKGLSDDTISCEIKFGTSNSGNLSGIKQR